jgi:hypothetical protein
MRNICPDRHPDLSEEQRQLVRTIRSAQHPYNSEIWSDAYRLLLSWNSHFDSHPTAKDFAVNIQCHLVFTIWIWQQSWDLPWCRPMPFWALFNTHQDYLMTEVGRLQDFLDNVLLVKDLCPDWLKWFPIKITRRNCPVKIKPRILSARS